MPQFGKCIWALFTWLFLDASGDGQPLSGDWPSLLGTDSQGGVGEDPSCKSTRPSSTPLLSCAARLCGIRGASIFSPEGNLPLPLLPVWESLTEEKAEWCFNNVRCTCVLTWVSYMCWCVFVGLCQYVCIRAYVCMFILKLGVPGCGGQSKQLENFTSGCRKCWCESFSISYVHAQPVGAGLGHTVSRGGSDIAEWFSLQRVFKYRNVFKNKYT